MNKVILVLLVIVQTVAHAQEKQMLLVGTFHFNNPGADVVKTKSFDVTTVQSQKELEAITDKIRQFKPDRIFVEWEFDQQEALDSLYMLYKNGSYFDYVGQKYPGRKFYLQNEIFQLAFRAALKSKLDRVYAIDYTAAEFPFDSLMNSIDSVDQPDLKKRIHKVLEDFTSTTNEKMSKQTLTQLLLGYNDPAYRKMDMSLYLSLLNKAGKKENFVGAYLVSEWYRRNLYMYSLVQKMTRSSDQKIMVLLGAGHASMFNQFAEWDQTFESIDLRQVLR